MEPPASAAGATPSAAVPSNPVVVLKTNMGTIEVQLDPDHAPLSTQNFLSYVRKGQYNGTVFHRVIPNFMIQGGGLTRDLVEKRAGAGIKNESNNGLKNARGTIAMARTPDPDSATCQFFINVVDNPGLDYQPGRPGYAVFGKVVSGMDVVDKIRNVPTHTAAGGLQNVPVQTVLIESASVK
jgi:peptidyl-prolyl cis-trans isomerase A (cyclophilin A)